MPKPREERELAHKLLQGTFVRDDRLARISAACPLVLHSLHSPACAFPKQRDDVKHTIRPDAPIAPSTTSDNIIAAISDSTSVSRHVASLCGRRRRGCLHATHELPQIAEGHNFRDGAWGDRHSGAILVVRQAGRRLRLRSSSGSL
jgi:hypothetical protein